MPGRKTNAVEKCLDYKFVVCHIVCTRLVMRVNGIDHKYGWQPYETMLIMVSEKLNLQNNLQKYFLQIRNDLFVSI